MKLIKLKNKNNEDVLPDFITDDLSSNSHVKTPSIYGIKNYIENKIEDKIDEITPMGPARKITGIGIDLHNGQWCLKVTYEVDFVNYEQWFYKDDGNI